MITSIHFFLIYSQTFQIGLREQKFFSREGIIFHFFSLKIDLIANSVWKDHPRMHAPAWELRHNLYFNRVQILLSFGYFYSQSRVWENKPEVIILIRSYGYKGVV